jgi:hypothetical protein
VARTARGQWRRALRVAARLRASPASDLPSRLRQVGVRATDPLCRPPRVGPGPSPTWPLPVPAVEAPPALRVHGSDVPAASWTDWDRDPATGALWPRRRALDLFGAGLDPRSAWEVTRLHHVARRALAGDAGAVDAAVAFTHQVPPGVGIAWAVPLEAAIRLVSLVLVATADPAGSGRTPALRRAVAAHAAWIARHPSRGSSANNHRVAELGALALAGRALDAPGWLRQAQRELPAVLRDQVHPDGVGVEQSPSYLAFDLEWALLARLCGVADLDDPVDRAAGFLCALLDAGGHAPQIGDDDGGRVVPCESGPSYVCSVAGAARAALGRPPPPAWAPDLRSALLVGDVAGPPLAPHERACLSGLGPGFLICAPEQRSAHFPAGGLTALRSPRALVVVDHGPLGGCTLAAHGHADAASAWVHLDGAPLVVGRGTFRYHPAGTEAGPHGRRFDRGTGAHPTVIVDGVDQSAQHPDHPFLWRRRAEATAEHVDLVARRLTVRVEGAPHGVLHRRTVALHDDRLVLTDECTGDAAPHHVAVVLPLAPDVTASQERAGTVAISRRGAVIAVIHADPAAEVRVVQGGARPGLGWHATSYGVAEPAPAVVVERWGRLPARLRTVVEFVVRPASHG